jgi:complement component 1 Q subcomponent-binding protein
MFSSGQAAKKLSASLKKEFEQEADVLSGDYYDAENGIVKDYLKAHPEWKITEKSLIQDVYLSKHQGNTDITVTFSRQAEDFDAQMEQQQEEGQEEKAPAPLLPFTVLIGKGDKGTLSFDCVYRTGDRVMQIQSTKFFPDSKVAVEDSAPADHSRRCVYDGPDLQQYDEAALEKFYQYLEEQGVDDDFAAFLDAFSTLKERRDYADYLRTVGKFLDA